MDRKEEVRHDNERFKVERPGALIWSALLNERNPPASMLLKY